jgi:hypothetical protein
LNYEPLTWRRLLPCRFRKDTVKNLLDVLQKLSLAIAAVSLALLSTILLPRHNVEKDAIPELARLQSILGKMADRSPKKIIDEALGRVGQNAGSESLTEQLTLNDFAPYTVQISFPSVIYQTSNSDLKQMPSDLRQIPFNEIQKLGDLHKAWDIVASITKFYKLGGPRWMYLQIPDLDQTPLELSYRELPPGAAAVPLERLGDPKVPSPSDPIYIWIYYNFAPMLTDIGDKNKLMRIFGLTENQRDSLETVRLWV